MNNILGAKGWDLHFIDYWAQLRFLYGFSDLLASPKAWIVDAGCGSPEDSCSCWDCCSHCGGLCQQSAGNAGRGCAGWLLPLVAPWMLTLRARDNSARSTWHGVNLQLVLCCTDLPCACRFMLQAHKNADCVDPVYKPSSECYVLPIDGVLFILCYWQCASQFKNRDL